MTPQNIKALINQTQSLMYGFNYEVKLGIELFENCSSLSDISAAIKSVFPKSNPKEIEPLFVSVEDFYNDVMDKFSYRGDNIGVSLKLTEKQEEELRSKQGEIMKFINQFINANTEIYSYEFLEGLPGCPVFWEYTFILLNKNAESVLFYGSSSD